MAGRRVGSGGVTVPGRYRNVGGDPGGLYRDVQELPYVHHQLVDVIP